MTKEELIQSQSFDEIISSKSLTPLFQPIVSLSRNTIFGYEALIRGPSDSPLHSPINLFDAASRLGRLAELDLLCREVSIAQFGKLRLEGKLFLNTIPAALLQPEYQQGLTLNFLQRVGLSPEQVVIELTEQYPIDDYQLMRGATEYYRNMGFSIAIDDLGSGYSGLRTWSEIKPDFVKLDRHFIQNIHEDAEKRRFVKSIFDIAKDIGCLVIAEGIEVREEYITVHDMNIGFTQGYYFGRPSTHPERTLEATLFAKRQPITNADQHKQRTNTTVHSLLAPLEPAQAFETVSIVGERFRKDLKLSSIPVINADLSVAGIVWRDEFMTLYASQYGRDLHGRKPIHNFMDSNPIIADVNSPLKELSQQITRQSSLQKHSTFIITEHNKYRGVGGLVDLLRQITDVQIATARHANPLSGLPGNVPISEQTKQAIEKRNGSVMCYFDLDNFKPYNDIYGFSKGDQVIKHTADILTSHVNPEVDFIGHVGGDDFIILFESQDWKKRCKHILADFTELYPDLYTDQHLDDKGITALDRHGNNTFYPLLSFSIGAVCLLDFDTINNEADLVELATKAKSAAKKVAGNSLYQINP